MTRRQLISLLLKEGDNLDTKVVITVKSETEDGEIVYNYYEPEFVVNYGDNEIGIFAEETYDDSGVE